MSDYDVFNGDADGICALLQLRLAEPRDARLVTGVKRDISLLRQVKPQAGDRITVLDVSLDKNREALNDVLAAGAEVFYADHHFAGEIPASKRLHAMINPAPDVCTALLVNGHLEGRFVEWAIVGAFGDNLHKSAEAIARPLHLSRDELKTLENLGTYLNYNGYGASIEDLHFTPADLFRLLLPHQRPQDFIANDRASFNRLERGYQEDMASARAARCIFDTPHAAVFMLPDEPWARRVSGVYGNQLANEHPSRAHAVITERNEQGYLISVRAPLENKTGADEICRQFPTGGGRKAAAGVNDLPVDQLEQFISTFQTHYAS